MTHLTVFHRSIGFSLIRLLSLSLVVFGIVVQGLSQEASNGPKSLQRDPAAQAVVQAAILALGGDRLQGLQNCIAQGQARRGHSVGTFKWENSGSDFRYEEAVSSVTSVVVSNQGTPTSVMGKQVMRFPAHFMATLFSRPLVGVTLSRYYSDSTVGLAMAKEGTAISASGFRVEVTFPQDQDPLMRKVQQEWTMDSKTGLPTRVHQWVPGYPIANFIRQSDTYLSNYKILNGVPVPSHIDEYSGKTLMNSYDIESLQCNAALSQSDFTVQGGGQ